MAELPEVEVVKQYLDATSLHQEIERVEVADPRVLKDMTPRKFSALLKKDSLEKTLRHGSHLFVGTGRGHWLAWSLGAAGAGSVRYLAKKRKNREFERMTLHFANGARLSYTSTRMAGKIQKIPDPWKFIRERSLGPDALSPDLSPEAARVLLLGRKAKAKTRLMNQRIIAGIGNVYSDEILFQAGIHPEADLAGLSPPAFGGLLGTMKDVLSTAVSLRADPMSLPDSWLIPRRKDGEACPEAKCKSRISKGRIAGKNAYFCPSCQKPAPEPVP